MQVKKALLASALLVSAPTVWAEDLLQIYQAAVQQDPVYAAATAAHRATQEKVPEGRAALLPNVNLSANTTWNEIDTQYRGSTSLPFPAGMRKYNSNGYTVMLDQPIVRMQNYAQYAQAKQQAAAGDAQLTDAQQNLVLRVAQAYFDYLLAQDGVNLAEAQKKAIAEQLEIAKKSFEVGTSTITDTNEAQARFDLINAQEIAAQQDLAVKRQQLVSLTGQLPGELLPLSAQFAAKSEEPASVDAWLQDAMAGNPQLRAQQANVEIARQEVKKSQAGHLPTLDLVASYSDNGAGNSTFGVGTDTTAKTVGLQLNIPLYAGGGISARAREAVAGEDQARANLEGTRRQVELNVKQSFLDTQSSLLRVKALEQALVSAQSALDSNKLGFQVGVRTSADVLNAQQQYYSARHDLQAARYQWILADLRLRAAAGKLGQADLARVNGYLGKS